MPNERSRAIAQRMKNGVMRFYESFEKLFDKLDVFTANTFDARESMAMSIEEEERIMSPYVKRLEDAIDEEMMTINPMDAPLFRVVARLIFFSTMFVSYRQILKAELEEHGVTAFRSLSIMEEVRTLANALCLTTKQGKTIRFIYTHEERKMWKELASRGRKQYKGIRLVDTEFVDVIHHFSEEDICKAKYHILKEIFKYDNIEKCYAAGNNGMTLGISDIISSDNYFASMQTFEQYVVSLAVSADNIKVAKQMLDRLHKAFPDNQMVIAYQTKNGTAMFYGIWTCIEECAKECDITENAVMSQLRKNKKMTKGRMELAMDCLNRSFFPIEAFEEYINH